MELQLTEELIDTLEGAKEVSHSFTHDLKKRIMSVGKSAVDPQMLKSLYETE